MNDDQHTRREADDQPEFAIHIGARLVSATTERVEFEMPVTKALTNRNGVLHGGARHTLAVSVTVRPFAELQEEAARQAQARPSSQVQSQQQVQTQSPLGAQMQSQFQAPMPHPSVFPQQDPAPLPPLQDSKDFI